MPETSTSFRQLLESQFDAIQRQITLNVSFGEQVNSLLQLINQEQLSLQQATLDPPLGTLSSSPQTSLTGKVTLWEVQEVDIGITFIEADKIITLTTTFPRLSFVTISRYIAPINSSTIEGLDINFPQAIVQANTQTGEMIVTGTLAENWSLLGIDGISIEKPELMLKVQTDPELLNNYVVEFIGKIKLKSLEIPVSIDIPLGIGGWRINILPPGIPLPSLTDLLELMGGLDIPASLPSQVSSLTAFTLSSLTIQFDPKTPSWQGTNFTITSSHAWEIASKLTIENITLTLSLRPNTLGIYYTGSIFGRLKIGILELGAIIPLPLTGLLTLEAHSNQPLPGLGELAKLIDADYAAALPDGMGNIGSLVLNYIRVQVDLDTKKIAFFGFDVFSVQPWVIIPSHLDLETFNFNLEVIPFNQQWGITGLIAGKITVEGIKIATAIQRYDPSGGWKLWLTEPLHLPGLVGLVNLVGGDYLGSLLPPTMDSSIGALTVFSFSMDFSGTPQKLRSLSLRLGTTNEWQFSPGYFSLDELDISVDIIQPTDSSNRQSQIYILGLLSLGNIPIRLSADKPITDTGWQFEGSTGKGREIPIGDLIDDLGQKFNVTVPAALADLTLNNIQVSFNTKTHKFFFTCEGKFPLENKTADIVITIDLNRTTPLETNSPVVYEDKFSGHLTIGELNFDLLFDQNNSNSKTLIATYNSPGKLPLKNLIEAVSSDPDLLNIVENIEIDLKDILFVYSNQNNQTKLLFGLDIGTNINLSNLPLVGQEFPRETVGVKDLQLLVIAKDLTTDEVTAINNLLPSGVTQLPLQTPANNAANNASTPPPETNTPNTPNTPAIAIPKGLNVTAQMEFGDSPLQPLTLSVSGTSKPTPNTTLQPTPNTTPDTTPSTTPSTTPPPTPNTTPSTTPNTTPLPTPANTSPVDNAKWFPLQKSFGPVNFQRVGVQYQDAVLLFLLDAALSLAGLNLSLEGLSVGSPLNEFSPKFDLRGLGLAYENGPLEIGGAFLRVRVTPPNLPPYDEYDGAAIIKTEELTLSAIGSYAYLEGHPSLFIYAVLDYPLGGPSFFFVTGLAAGFGYNRSLKVPPIEQIAQFPLVEAAVNPNPSSANPASNTQNDAQILTQELTKLRAYVPPATGEIFLAVGVKFTSFKLIDSFVLLTVAFGNRFELDVLGLATAIIPTPEVANAVPPLAEIQMAIKASFIPDEGFLGVAAQLTSASYVFSRDCHLTGGFAFYSWFSGEHAGDFVTTLGGYHPSFTVPTHYPKVPRLGFNWQVDNQLSLKGGVYFALTPAVLMAGGYLQATWNSGNLKAWFNAEANFIIAWKPYHYDAVIYVGMGVSYTFQFWGSHTINVDVSADLHIWGPEFTGKARIHLQIISFEVTFGNYLPPQPEAIDWNTFTTSFLPPAEDICSIVVKDGLVSKASQDTTDLGVINPTHFLLATNSLIPSNQAYWEAEGQNCTELNIDKANKNFGIGSMDVKSNDLTSTHIIAITRNGENVEQEFEYVPILKNVPVALWGQSLQPDLNGEKYISNTLSGFEIKPKNPPNPGETAPIPLSQLQFSTDTIKNAYGWENFLPFTAEASEDEARRSKIKTTLVNNLARKQLLKALEFSEQEVDAIALDSSVADNFLIAPQIGAFVS